jgi:hypothetical protein
LLIPAGTRGVKFNLDAATSGMNFPGRWALVSFYMQSPGEMHFSTTLWAGAGRVAQESQTSAGGSWQPVVMDMPADPFSTTVPATAASPALWITFDQPLAAPVHVDNLILVDNTRMLVTEKDFTEGMGQPWNVRIRGKRVSVVSPDRFSITDRGPVAWNLSEANPVRVCWVSADGKGRRAVYNDGRLYENGKLLTADHLQGATNELFAAEHEKPAKIEISPSQGSMLADTPGDENNDGYNEMLGAYQILGNGSALEVKIIPQTPAMASPVLEIAGLKEGKPVVTMEGTLATEVLRTAGWHWLVVLPGRIDKPVTVNINIKSE